MTNEPYYEHYLTGDPFLEEFVAFSKKNRERYDVTGEREFWPLAKLYEVLKHTRGGFILDLGEHACLGIKVEPDPANPGHYTVTYRDPFSPDPKTIHVNARTLQTSDGRRVKIQWFGKFQFLTTLDLSPGFSTLAKFSYKLQLPKEQEKLVQQNNFFCGDISAFLASKSNIVFSVRPEVD